MKARISRDTGIPTCII